MTGARPGTTPTRIALIDGLVDRGDPDVRSARVERVSTPWGAAPVSRHATACAVLLIGQGVREPVGILPDAVLVSVPVLGVRERSRADRDRLIARGIAAATEAGAEVIAMPFGRADGSRRISLALDAAADSGVVLFAAAGNLGPSVLTFPANHPRVWSVTARGPDGILPDCCACADIIALGEFASSRLRGTSPAVVIAAGRWLRAGRPDLAGYRSA